MLPRRLRIYPDTSVFGGVFDEEFAHLTAGFWAGVRDGRYDILLSDPTLSELKAGAPDRVRALVSEIPVSNVERLELDPQSEQLAAAYLAHGALPGGMLRDAQHIALATTARADALVSWNFKHIVNLRRIRLYQAVNREMGYASLDICTPKEAEDNG